MLRFGAVFDCFRRHFRLCSVRFRLVFDRFRFVFGSFSIGFPSFSVRFRLVSVRFRAMLSALFPDDVAKLPGQPAASNAPRL